MHLYFDHCCLLYWCFLERYRILYLQSFSNRIKSSINDDGGLGTASLSTIYAALVVSCMFVPTWLITTLKCKWTLVLCQLCYSTYILAQFWPMFETLIPAAIVLGIGAAPMVNHDLNICAESSVDNKHVSLFYSPFIIAWNPVVGKMYLPHTGKLISNSRSSSDYVCYLHDQIFKVKYFK